MKIIHKQSPDPLSGLVINVPFDDSRRVIIWCGSTGHFCFFAEQRPRVKGTLGEGIFAIVSPGVTINKSSNQRENSRSLLGFI